jgi:hypothetical protein
LPYAHGMLWSLPLLGKPHKHGHGEGPRSFRLIDGPASMGQQQEWQTLREHVGLTDSRGNTVEGVCLHTVLRQAQKKTSGATAARRLDSLTALHDSSGPLKSAQQHKAHLVSCASRASSIWLTALPIQIAPHVRCGSEALVDPPLGYAAPNFFKQAEKRPQICPQNCRSKLSHGLQATTFLLQLGAKSCDQ